MLAIRLQRLGRKGYPVYRLAVQEAQRHPSSGRVVAYVGSYNPHTKEANVQVEAAQKFLDNGAQPTPRVVKLLKDAGVKLPRWVKEPSSDKQKNIRNAEKLRKNQPKEEAAPEEPAAVEAAPTEEVAVEPVEEAAPAEA
jgi:small subunit ribosomal protein S16